MKEKRPNIVRLSKFMGRFGNQVGQYALARTLAHKFSASLETPTWIGETIFSLPPSPRTPVYIRDSPQESLPVSAPCSIHGYYQYQAAFSLMSRALLKSWLRIDSSFLRLVPRPFPYYICAHLRHGDYRVHSDKYACIEKSAFQAEIARLQYHPGQVIYLSEESPHPDSAKVFPDYPFLYDFLLLMQANVIFRSNSTFSQWAAILSNAEAIYSPLTEGLVGSLESCQWEPGLGPCNYWKHHHLKAPHNRMDLPA